MAPELYTELGEGAGDGRGNLELVPAIKSELRGEIYNMGTYLASTALGSSCSEESSEDGLLYLEANLYLSDSLEQEQLRRV